MKNIRSFAIAAAVAAVISTSASAKDTQVYEMRTYYAAPGKLEALNARFRDHTLKLFAKHGMVNLGYWVPVDNQENKLVYIIVHPSQEARATAWKAFGADPAWKAVVKTTEANGRLVTKVDAVLLQATDFSPALTPSVSEPARVFELRTYTASPGNLDNLLARFRDHTLKLFAKHGMTSFGYWTPMEKKDGAGEKLVYILAHKSKEAADASFKAFRADPDWVSAKKASEDKAGGSLTVANGVKSEFMTPTDYSPTR